MKDLRDTITRASRYDVVRSTPNDQPGCLACRLGMFPGHKHMPMPEDLKQFAEENRQGWPSFGIPVDWKVKKR